MPSHDERPLHFIYHVPKCAGRTIDHHLTDALPRHAYHRMQKRRGLGRFVTGYDPSYLPNAEMVRAVSGHHLGLSLDCLFPNRSIKRSLLLRDPASHFVSYYNYRMTRYIGEGLKPYAIDVAYGAMRRNFITHYILANFLELNWAQIASLSDQDKYDLVNAFLSMFWFVGDYGLCDELLANLADDFGISADAPAQNTLADLARGAGWRPLTLGMLPKRVLAAIRAENQIDQSLWETWGDVRHETGAVRPVPLAPRGTSFISNEAVRFVNQILRRMQRRWGVLGAPAPIPQEDPAIAT
ncbi:MAG: hypothetical protein AAF405_08805 [Pseudomonadota bacterium]